MVEGDVRGVRVRLFYVSNTSALIVLLYASVGDFTPLSNIIHVHDYRWKIANWKKLDKVIHKYTLQKK